VTSNVRPVFGRSSLRIGHGTTGNRRPRLAAAVADGSRASRAVGYSSTGPFRHSPTGLVVVVLVLPPGGSRHHLGRGWIDDERLRGQVLHHPHLEQRRAVQAPQLGLHGPPASLLLRRFDAATSVIEDASSRASAAWCFRSSS